MHLGILSTSLSYKDKVWKKVVVWSYGNVEREKKKRQSGVVRNSTKLRNGANNN